MKKQLLSIALFLLTINFASAQTTDEITVPSDDFTEQTYTVGKQAGDDLNDFSIVAVTSGTGTTSENNSYFSLNGDNNTDTLADPIDPSSSDNVQGTFTFKLKASAESFNAAITVNIRKRTANDLEGTFSDGTTSVPFSDLSNGDTANSFKYITVELPSVVLTTTAKTFTINITSLKIGTLETASLPTARLYNVYAQNLGVISTNAIETASKINLYPNPATDNFNIQSNDTVNSISVYSLNGQLVKSFAQSASYDISDLAPGLYSVRINSISGSKTIKLLKK